MDPTKIQAITALVHIDINFNKYPILKLNTHENEGMLFK